MPSAPAAPSFDLPPARRTALRRRLLAWYDTHHRPMPWRAEPGTPANPYHVFLSEAMLQQTQVATVIPYFHRFIARFPTLADLAAADEQAVLTLWQGLGYYRRARHLHRAAQELVQEHAGRIPADPQVLLKLPGVGRYTAGAIASIAHQVRTPLVDGNVKRVLARLLLFTEPVDAPATDRTLWQVADHLVPADRPGDFNQGLMELGATVCTPAAPACGRCPWSSLCRGLAEGKPAELPNMLPKRRPSAVKHHILALVREDRYLFEQRPDTGLWSRMWQLTTTDAAMPTPATALPAWALERYGLTIAPPEPLAEFKHATTHRAITFHLWRSQVTGGRLRPGPSGATWRALDAIEDLPLAKPQWIALQKLQHHPPTLFG